MFRPYGIWLFRPSCAGEDTFLRMWTRKEALLKATGVGIGDALASYDSTRPAPEPWVVRDLAAPPGFAAAIASPAGPSA